MSKMHGSYDRIVMYYERGARPKIERKFPCGCCLHKDGHAVFCLEHWSPERIKKRKWTIKEMEEMCHKSKEESQKHLWDLWSLSGGELGEEPPEEVVEEWR